MTMTCYRERTDHVLVQFTDPVVRRSCGPYGVVSILGDTTFILCSHRGPYNGLFMLRGSHPDWYRVLPLATSGWLLRQHFLMLPHARGQV